MVIDLFNFLGTIDTPPFDIVIRIHVLDHRYHYITNLFLPSRYIYMKQLLTVMLTLIETNYESKAAT